MTQIQNDYTSQADVGLSVQRYNLFLVRRATGVTCWQRATNCTRSRASPSISETGGECRCLGWM